MAFLRNLLIPGDLMKSSRVQSVHPRSRSRPPPLPPRPRLLQIVTPKTSESEEYLSEDEEVVEEETVGCTVEDTDPGRVCDSTTLNLYRDFDLPVKKLRRREIKWMHMIKSWDKFVSRHYEKVRERCRKGIPPAVRGQAWFYLCNGHSLRTKHPHLYDHLVQLPGDEKIIDEIQRDIHRQFPTHEMFAEPGGSGQSELFNVLKAYAAFNKRDGYCQAHAPLAATLLMQMPSEQAFFCLASICNHYLPLYFAPDLQMLQVDANLLMSLLKKTEPAVYKHLKRQGVTPILFMTDWFMCVYTRNLPWETVLRVWDMFFCEGRKVLFRVGLTILRLVLGPAAVRKECPSMHETVTRLRNLPSQLVEADNFLPEMGKLKLSEDELSVLFRRHWAEFEAQKNENMREAASRATLRATPGGGGGAGSGDYHNAASGASSKKSAGTWGRKKTDAKPAR